MGRLPVRHTLLLLVLVIATPLATLGDDALKRRIEVEYPPALAKLEARYDKMHGQALHHTVRKPAGKPPITETLKYDFAFIPGHAKMVITATEPDNAEILAERAYYQSVYAANPRYGFHLSRRREQDPLVLRTLFEDAQKGMLQVINKHAEEVQCTIRYEIGKISNYISMKMFEIQSATPDNATPNQEQILIRFTLKMDPKLKRPTDIDTDGWLVVSPNKGWIIRESGAVLTQQGKILGTKITKIEYKQSNDGHFDPTSYVQRRYRGRVDRDTNDDAVVDITVDLKSVEYEALPESEFRLPAFGMPEVDPEVKKGAAEKPLGLFAAAGVGFVLAGGLKYAASRRKRF